MLFRKLAGYFRSRRKRRELDAYEPLIATPSGFPVTLPANGEILASYSLTTVTDTHLVTINGDRNMYSSARVADVRVSLGRLDRAHVITKNAGLAGIVKLYVRDGLGTAYKIAEG